MLHCVEEAENLVRDCLTLPDDADLRVRVFGGGRATIGKDHGSRREGGKEGRGGWRMGGGGGWDGRGGRVENEV
jgi:hypothetical protein